MTNNCSKTVQLRSSSKAWVVAVLVLSLLLSGVTLPAVQAQTDNSTSTASEECATETSTINSDPTLQQALLDLKTNISTIIEEDFYQFCSILDGGRCTVNLTTYYPETLPSACTDAGGQLAKQKASLHCTGKVWSIPIPGGVRLEFIDIPACVGLSCNLSGNGDGSGGVPTIVEDAIEQVLDEVGQVVESGLEDGNCTAAIGASSAAAAIGSARHSWIASTALAVLVGLLFTGTVPM